MNCTPLQLPPLKKRINNPFLPMNRADAPLTSIDKAVKRVCTCCNEEKELELFYFHRTRNHYESWCKTCYRKKVSDSFYKLPVEERRRRWNKSSRVSVKRHWFKQLARKKVAYAISTGKLKRLPCEKCGETIVDAHHKNYSKPLEVKWLCRQHHRDAHHPV